MQRRLLNGPRAGSSSGGDWDLEDPHSEDLHPKEPPETEIEPSRESLLEQDEEEERALVQAAIGINLDEYGGQEQGARASAPPPGPARGWNLTSLFSTVHSKVKVRACAPVLEFCWSAYTWLLSRFALRHRAHIFITLIVWAMDAIARKSRMTR